MQDLAKTDALMPHLALSKIRLKIQKLDQLSQCSHTSVMQYLQRRLVILCISATSFFSLLVQHVPQGHDGCTCTKLPKLL